MTGRLFVRSDGPWDLNRILFSNEYVVVLQKVDNPTFHTMETRTNFEKHWIELDPIINVGIK